MKGATLAESMSGHGPARAADSKGAKKRKEGKRANQGRKKETEMERESERVREMNGETK